MLSFPATFVQCEGETFVSYKTVLFESFNLPLLCFVHFIKMSVAMASAKRHSHTKTRNSMKSCLFGTLCKLKDLQTTSYDDVMHPTTGCEVTDENCIYLQPVNDLIKIVSEKVIEIWVKASIRVVSKRTINGRLRTTTTTVCQWRNPLIVRA